MSDHVVEVSHELLVRELCKVTEWDVLGIYLGLDESEITEIERDHQSNARRRIAMFAKWLEKDVAASWEVVIDSLESMSQIRLANQLKEKYCTESESTAKQAEPKADVKELMVDRQQSIVREIENIEESYLLLVTNVHFALAEANLSLIKMQMFSKFYSRTKVTTVEELFDLLEPFHFLDYALLEKIVKFFLRQHTVADDLRDYLQQLDKFKSSTTIKQFIESIEQAQQEDNTTRDSLKLCTVTLRLVGGWLDKTMDDLEKLVKEIFKDKAYVLSHLKIVRGSVIVTYSAPQSEAESLMMLALEQSSFLTNVGVIELMVGDTMIAHSDSANFSFEYSLFGAVFNNDLNLLIFLLNIKTSPDAIVDEVPAVMLATQLSRKKALSVLLKANADPNIQDNNGTTPLYIASEDGSTKTVVILLKAKANVNFQTADGETPLHIASLKGHSDVVSLLLKAKANVNLQTADGETPLHVASQEGHIDIVLLLLEANADSNFQTADGSTALSIASYSGHTDVVFVLLSANVDVNLQTKKGGTPLHFASLGQTGIVSALLDSNADINLKTNDGATPLHFASIYGQTDIVSVLLDYNADINLQTDNGVTPLLIAAEQGNTDIVSLLLDSNADINHQENNGATSLHMASQEGHTDIVSILLKANAKINLQKANGTTPLYFASQEGHTDIVSLLLEANADINLPRADGATPLFVASLTGHTDVVSLLLKANADINLQAADGDAPLPVASLQGHTDIVCLLLEANANINLQTENNFTSLMFATQQGHSQVVQLLLSNGADPNLKTNEGFDALIFACLSGSFDSVELLLMYGANPMNSLARSYKATALDVAAYSGHEDIVDLLKAVELSQSSTTSQPVRTANEIASNLDNETIALINHAMEKIIVKKTESFITTEYQKHKRTALTIKQYNDESYNTF